MGPSPVLKKFGATVTLEGGIQGLLHVSQVSQVYVRNIEDVLSVGDAVRCVVIKLDPNDGSVALSTKMLEATPGEMLTSSAAVFERSRSPAPAANTDA